MKDLIPKGTGDSRTLKSNISANTTFTEFLSMLRSGTLPIDIGAINAGGVQQMGTPLNKENLLTDETAGKFNFSPSENPNINDVFCFLGQKTQGSYTYVWKKTKYTESLGESVAGQDRSDSTTFFSDSIIIDQSNGNVSMATQEKLTFNYGTVEEANAALSGKYIEPTTSNLDWKGIHKIESVTGINITAIGSSKVTVTTKKVTSSYNEQIITTEDKNAYYEGYVDQSGWTYFEFFEETHDKIGFVETGYYVGTGESGELSPNSLTFDFVPKLIFLFDSGGRPHIQYNFNKDDSTPIYGLCSSLTTKFEKDKLFNLQRNLHIFAKKTEDGKTISWYVGGAESHSKAQFNEAGVIYLYFALG